MSKIYIAAVQYDNGEGLPEDHIQVDTLFGAGATFDKAVESFKPHIETTEKFYKKIEDEDKFYCNPLDLLGDGDNVTIYAEYESLDIHKFEDMSSYVVYYVIEMEVAE